MLSARVDFELDALARIGGWRKQTRPSTPGLVKQALAAAFFNFPPVSLLGPFHPIRGKLKIRVESESIRIPGVSGNGQPESINLSG
jgi:hypothetical protein